MKPIRVLLLAFTFLLGWSSARCAELYQTITIIVKTPESFAVERKPVALADLESAIQELASGDRKIAVKLYVPLWINRPELAQIKHVCRKAGVSFITIIHKD
jgi:hypothetical protein